VENNFKVGQILKLKKDMFGSGEAEATKHYGDLGYPGLMKDWAFKVVEFIEHKPSSSTTIIMAKVDASNIKGVMAQFYVQAKDCVPAVMKMTVDYTILDNTSEKTALETRLAQLKSERVALKASGLKVTGRKLTANKKGIDAVEKSIKNFSDKPKILLNKINKVVEVTPELLANKSELEMALANEVALYRQQFRKESKPVVKKVWNKYDVSLVGGVHKEPYTYGKILENSLKDFIKENKVPTDPKSNYIGIELECLTRCRNEELEKLFIEARLHRNVQVGSDGSINVDQSGYHPVEIKVLVTEQELDTVMMKIHRILRSRKVDAYANRSCGTHVHLDMRNRDVNVAYTKLFNVQSLLRKAQPTSRQINSYCKPNQINSFKEVERRDAERYSVINTNAFKKFKTLEIRVHEGTVSGINIINWCKFLVGVLSANTVINSPVSTMDQLKKLTLDIPQAGLDYIENRIAEFGDEEVA